MLAVTEIGAVSNLHIYRVVHAVICHAVLHAIVLFFRDLLVFVYNTNTNLHGSQ